MSWELHDCHWIFYVGGVLITVNTHWTRHFSVTLWKGMNGNNSGGYLVRDCSWNCENTRIDDKSSHSLKWSSLILVQITVSVPRSGDECFNADTKTCPRLRGCLSRPVDGSVLLPFSSSVFMHVLHAELWTTACPIIYLFLSFSHSPLSVSVCVVVFGEGEKRFPGCENRLSGRT